MGNNISQISIACGLVTAEELQTERQDVCVGTTGRLPADHDDFAPRLASLGIPLLRRFHLGARRGTRVHEALRDAINLLSEAAHSADAVPCDSQMLESRVRAVSLLMRLGAFDRVVMPRPIETPENFLLVLHEDTPAWLHHLFAQASAYSQIHADSAPEDLRERLSRLAFTQINLDELQKEVGDPVLVIPALRGETDKVRRLIAQGCDVNARDHLGRSAVHAAAIGGAGRLIRILHEAGAALDIRDHEGRTPVELAVLSNKAGALSALIENGVPLNEIGYRGLTPLAMAASLGLGESIRQLLAAGADPNLAGSGGSPIHHAILSRNLNALEKLLQYNADPMAESKWGQYLNDDLPARLRQQTVTPLECAALTGQQRLFNRLVAHGADLKTALQQGRPLLSRAVMGGSRGFVDTLVKAGAKVDEVDSDGRTALQWAAAKGTTEMFDHLLKLGADPHVVDREGSSVMHAAVAGLILDGEHIPDDALIERILKIDGIKVDARNLSNQTPLHVAASGKRPSLIDVLVKAGANLEAKDDQRRSALHFAAKEGGAATLAALLAHGADHRAKDCYGQTPLHFAVERNQIEVLQTLIDKGANPSEFNNLGLLPVHIAAYRGDIDMLEVLCRDRVDLLSKPGRAGATALRIARNRGKTECAAWIEAKIADAATSSSIPRRAQGSRTGRPER